MTELGLCASPYISWSPVNRPAFKYLHSAMILASTMASEREITINMRLEDLTLKDLVIICGGTRDVV